MYWMIIVGFASFHPMELGGVSALEKVPFKTYEMCQRSVQEVTNYQAKVPFEERLRAFCILSDGTNPSPNS